MAQMVSYQHHKSQGKKLKHTQIMFVDNIGMQVLVSTKRDMFNIPVVFHSQIFKLPFYICYAINITATKCETSEVNIPSHPKTIIFSRLQP